MVKPSNVLSQWSQLIENFQASSQDFYVAFERAAAARAMPESLATVVLQVSDWNKGSKKGRRSPEP
jgi:hypothetical protein